MTESDRQKKRQSQVAGLENVTKMLDEARRVVDNLTQPPAGPAVQTPATGSSKKSEAEASPLKAPTSRKPGPASRVSPGRSQEATPPAPRGASGEQVRLSPPPLRPPDYFGISIRHRLHGRVRLKIRRMRNDWRLADNLQRGLAGLQGIAAVEANAATGTLLVVFDPQVLEAPQPRRAFSTLMDSFFPGLDVDSLIRNFL